MRRIALALCVALAMAGTGCTTIAYKTSQKAPPPVETPILATRVLLPDGPVALETLAPEQWPAAVKTWVAQATGGKDGPVADSLSLEDKTYLLVYGGRLPSEGYTIRFDRAEARGGEVTVNFTVVGPAHPESSRVEYLVAVARMARHDGAVHFPAIPPRPVPEDVKLGPLTIDLAQMQQIQAQVDNGHQPWRLDPVQVAMAEGQLLGFTPAGGDQFQLVSQDSAGNATVAVQHAGARYLVHLVQPNGVRLGSIWTIKAVSR